jgi:hypothetical protein
MIRRDIASQLDTIESILPPEMFASTSPHTVLARWLVAARLEGLITLQEEHDLANYVLRLAVVPS